MLEIGNEHPDKLLHQRIAKAIIGAAFDVHSELGYGFLERVYQRALQVELSRRGFSAEMERRIQVKYKGIIVGDYDADLVVAGSVVVEIKVNPKYDKRDEAQLLNELKATGLKVGLYWSTSVARKSSTNASSSESVFHPCSSVAE